MTPATPWLPKLLTSSYWIERQNKTKPKLQIYRICQNLNFSNFEKHFTRNTPSEDGQTDGRKNGRTRSNQYTPLQLRWAGLQWVNTLRPSNAYINGLVQERHNSSALAMELCLSCTNPLICNSERIVLLGSGNGLFVTYSAPSHNTNR